MDTVLVTGATGFIGLHCVEQLLGQGFRVKGTVRTKSRGQEVITAMEQASTNTDNLEIVYADLLEDEGWSDAVAGCRYVLHVASPFVLEVPKDENDLIKPAVEGTLRVLGACAGGDVEKVVLTSSFAAVGYGHADKSVFDESDWSNPDLCSPYPKSKTLAERAAWDFMQQLEEGDKFALTVLNPSAVTGPMLSSDIGTSNELILQMVSGAMPAVPKIHMGFVDVRDVAKAHVAAMTSSATDNNRIILSETEMYFSEMGQILRDAGYSKSPTKEMPNLIVKLVAIFNAQLKSVTGSLGRLTNTRKDKAHQHFGWKFISAKESALDTAQQLKAMQLF